jgi:hypothetical protein
MDIGHTLLKVSWVAWAIFIARVLFGSNATTGNKNCPYHPAKENKVGWYFVAQRLV